MEPCFNVAPLRREVKEGQSFNPDEFVIAPSTLYSKDNEEKHLLDAMLLAMPK